MPYSLRKAPNKNLYWVVGPDGTHKSKEPLPRKRAIAQMRALYAAEKSGGSFFTDAIQDGYNEVIELGKRTWNKISQVGDLDSEFWVAQYYPSWTKEALDKYGNTEIKNVILRKAPVMTALEYALEAISLGNWSSEKKKLNYDSMFHLAVLFNGKFVVEKLARINVATPIDNPANPEYQVVNVKGKRTLNEVMERTKEYMGDAFFPYDPFNNNCQDFVNAVLEANSDVFEYDKKDKEFVKQTVDVMLDNLPKYVPKFARTITSLGGLTGGKSGEIISAPELLNMCQQTYKYVVGEEPARKIGKWNLVESSYTLLLYRSNNNCVLAVRGTKEFRDVQSWNPVLESKVKTTLRYKDDLNTAKQWRQRHPVAWYGTGHSLGGAICDNLLMDFILTAGKAVSFNPAIEPAVLKRKFPLNNTRIYFEGDPLYALFGKEDPNSILVSDPSPGWIKSLIGIDLESHGLGSFEGKLDDVSLGAGKKRDELLVALEGGALLPKTVYEALEYGFTPEQTRKANEINLGLRAIAHLDSDPLRRFGARVMADDIYELYNPNYDPNSDVTKRHQNQLKNEASFALKRTRGEQIDQKARVDAAMKKYNVDRDQAYELVLNPPREKEKSIEEKKREMEDEQKAIEEYKARQAEREKKAAEDAQKARETADEARARELESAQKAREEEEAFNDRIAESILKANKERKEREEAEEAAREARRAELEKEEAAKAARRAELEAESKRFQAEKKAAEAAAKAAAEKRAKEEAKKKPSELPENIKKLQDEVDELSDKVYGVGPSSFAPRYEEAINEYVRNANSYYMDLYDVSATEEAIKFIEDYLTKDLTPQTRAKYNTKLEQYKAKQDRFVISEGFYKSKLEYLESWNDTIRRESTKLNEKEGELTRLLIKRETDSEQIKALKDAMDEKAERFQLRIVNTTSKVLQLKVEKVFPFVGPTVTKDIDSTTNLYERAKKKFEAAVKEYKPKLEVLIRKLDKTEEDKKNIDEMRTELARLRVPYEEIEVILNGYKKGYADYKEEFDRLKSEWEEKKKSRKELKDSFKKGKGKKRSVRALGHVSLKEKELKPEPKGKGKYTEKLAALEQTYKGRVKPEILNEVINKTREQLKELRESKSMKYGAPIAAGLGDLILNLLAVPVAPSSQITVFSEWVKGKRDLTKKDREYVKNYILSEAEKKLKSHLIETRPSQSAVRDVLPRVVSVLPAGRSAVRDVIRGITKKKTEFPPVKPRGGKAPKKDSSRKPYVGAKMKEQFLAAGGTELELKRAKKLYKEGNISWEDATKQVLAKIVGKARPLPAYVAPGNPVELKAFREVMVPFVAGLLKEKQEISRMIESMKKSNESKVIIRKTEGQLREVKEALAEAKKVCDDFGTWRRVLQEAKVAAGEPRD